MAKINQRSQKSWLLMMVFILLIGSFPLQPWGERAYAQYASDLFISEYVEGSSYNKAIEIFNGTDQEVDLSQYTLELYSNGSASASKTSLSGRLASGKTYVIVNGSANVELKNKANLENSSVVNFNGDDALVLKHNDTIIDAFGQVGFDPGSAWESGTVSTSDHTLVRKSSVTQGDTNAADAFDPSAEWDGYAGDTFDHIGSHTMDGFESGEPAPGPISATPAAMDIIFDNNNADQATVTGTEHAVAPGAKVAVYRGSPKENGSVLASVYADDKGAFTLTFSNSGNTDGFVFLTAAEEGKAESKPIRIDPAKVSPEVDAKKISFQVDGNGKGVVTGQAGAASAGTNQPFLYFYQGNPLQGGERLTDAGTAKDYTLANTDGSFSFTFGDASVLNEVYVTQLTWSQYGRNFESSSVAVLKSDKPAETILPLSEIRKNDENGKPVLVDKTVTVEGVLTVNNNIVGSNSLYIQDATGGVNLYQGSLGSTLVEAGDRVKVTGVVKFYNGLTEIVPTAIEITGKDSIPAAAEKSLTELSAYETAEPLEGMLVKAKGTITSSVQSGSSAYNLTLTDPDTKAKVTVRVVNKTGINATTLQLNKEYEFTGIFSQFDSSSPYTDGYQVFPRSEEDVKMLETPTEGELPLIYQVRPGKMEAVKDRMPKLSAKLEKTAADLDWNTLALSLDGTDLTTNVTKDEASGAISYQPEAELSYGEHKMVISISDTAGNKNEVTSYFYVQEELPDDQYHFYFGIPHSHTSFSDGKGTPTDAYQHAYEKGLDFLIVTDHSNWLDGDQYVQDKKEFQEKAGSEWAQTRQMADTFNKDHAGKFLALRGFEMTSGNWGHANVFNTSNYVEAKKTVTALEDFYAWLVNQEGAVASFNHPNWPSDSFNDLSYVPEIDHMMAMIEVGNGAPPYSYARAEEHFFRAMDNGWHVGADNAQDNHSTNWGDPDNLTAVVAKDLTTESFLDALRNRRTYSTEARDTQLRVKANGYWMGSTIEVPADRKLNFDIWVKDETNPIDKIQLLTNGGKVVDTKMAGGATEASWNPVVNADSGANWYVVKVVHSDGKWTTASAIFTVGGEMDVKLTGLDVNPDPTVPGSETTLTATISNMGVRSVKDLEVKFYQNEIKAENLVAKGTLGYLGPNSKGKIEGKWLPKTSGQTKMIALLTEKPGITTVTEMAKTVKVVASNGKKVLIDAFHANKEVPGAMNDFFELLRRYGYAAELNKEVLTKERLSGYDLLVLNTPTTTEKNLTNEEMEAVSSWVKDGGSLLMATTSNHQFPENTMLNPLLEKMGSGIRINNDNVYEPNSSKLYSGGMKWSIYFHNFPKTSEGLNENLDAIRYFSGSSLVDGKLQALTNNPSDDLEILMLGNQSSYNFNVAQGFYTYNSAVGDENDPKQTAGPDGEKIPLIAKERIGNGKIIVSGRHWYSDYEIGNDVSNTAFALRLVDYLAGVDRIQSIDKVRKTAKDGDIVTVQGVVTAPTEKFFDTVYIQDETGGIALYGTQGKDLPIGTKVIATGGIQHFEGELELTYEDSAWEVLYVGPGTPAVAKEVSLKEVADGSYVGQLVKTTGTIQAIDDANSTITLTDGSQEAYLLTDGYLPLDLGRFKVGDTIEAEGIASTGSFGNRIRIRFAEDLRLTGSGSGGGNGGGTTPPTTPPTPPADENRVPVEIKPELILEQIADQAKQEIIVQVTEPAIAEGKTAEIQMTEEILAQIADSGKPVVIETPKGSVTIPSELLKEGVQNKGLKIYLTFKPGKAGSVEIAAVRSSILRSEIVSLQIDGWNGTAPVTLSVPVDMNGVDDRLKLALYKQVDGSWRYQGGVVNETKDEMSMQITGNGDYGVIYYDVTYPDIAGHWAQGSVERMASRHVIKGMNEQSFAPEGTLTRAQFAGLLVRLLQLKGNGMSTLPFADVKRSDWFYEEVGAAYENGIVQGTSAALFKPNASVTRQDMVVMLVRALNKSGLSLTDQGGTAPSFTDENRIASYAEEAIQLAAKAGLVTGFPEGTFRPFGVSTRAQAATLLDHVLKLLTQSK